MKNTYFISLLIVMQVVLFVACEKENEEKSWKLDYSACVEETSNTSLEVATMNLKEFPYSGDKTILYVSQLIGQMDVDVIALQEISSEYWLNRLADECEGWEGVFSPVVSGNMSLAYLYKTSEITLDDDETEAIYTNDFYAFPRPPFKIKIQHKATGIDLYLINNHLKCCGGTDNENRRRDASEQLKDYIDSNLDKEKVIVLGDYNDRISDTESSDNVFWNFVEDASNYRFADMDIAKGSSKYWSYPSWPSHLDHILITNELFNNCDTVYTLRPSICQTDYPDYGSDHHPVVAIFK